jgi:dihydropteroate synthase
LGILTVTPDSFSDGGRFAAPADAIAAGRAMRARGAAIIDIGGESTRPGAAEVPASVELGRVLPVVEALAAEGVLVSIDTRKPAVARAALAAGAAIVNDIEGLRREEMSEVVAAAGAGVIIMHMRGTPESMQQGPVYEDVLREVTGWLADQAERAEAAGIDPLAIALDPGIGFGKAADHNLELIRGLGAVAALGYPVVVGASRKSFLGALTGTPDPARRLAASLAAALAAVDRGAAVVRVHDVEDTVAALQVHAALGLAPALTRR